MEALAEASQDHRLRGHEVAIAQLRAALGAGKALIAVLGPAGSGKSRLVREAIRRDPTRRWVSCEMSEITSEAGLVEALGVRFALTAAALDSRSALGQALTRLEPHTIVLENFCQLDSWADRTLVRLAAAATRFQWVVASRRPVESWDLLKIELAALDEEQALSLFSECARATPVDDSSPPGCEQLGKTGLENAVLSGNPRAIELAAAQYRAQMRVGDLAAQPADLDADGPDPDLLLAGLIARAWSELTASQQALLAQLAAFRAQFGAADALAVSGGAAADVQALLDKRLLIGDAETTAQDLLALPRWVHQMVELHAPSELRARCQIRHADWLLVDALQRFDSAHRDLAWLELRKYELQRLVRVPASSDETDETDESLAQTDESLESLAQTDAQSLAAATLLARLWWQRGPSAKAIELLDAAIDHQDHQDHQPSSARSPMLARALLLRGQLCDSVTNTNTDADADEHRAIDYFTAAVQMAEQCQDSALRHRVEQAIGEHLLQGPQGQDLDRAQQQFNSVLSWAHPEDASLRGRALTGLARIASSRSQLDQACALFEQAIELLSACDDHLHTISALDSLAQLQFTLGAFANVRARCRTILELTASSGARALEADATLLLARVSAGCDDDDHAAGQLFDQAQQLYRGRGDPQGESVAQLFDASSCRNADRAAQKLAACEPLIRALDQAYLSRCLDIARASAAFLSRQVPGSGLAERARQDKAIQLALDRIMLLQVSPLERDLLRIVRTRLPTVAQRGDPVALSRSGAWFQLPGQSERVELRRSRGGGLLGGARLLAALATYREHLPGVAVSTAQLQQLLWPGERSRRGNGDPRLGVVASKLRRSGLAEVLRRNHLGIWLDAERAVDWHP